MYAKLFSQIYDGTLCTKGPWEALVTFQQFLVLADPEGQVDMTAEAISRRTTIPLEIIQRGIQSLIQPDPESRTPAEEGRRLIPLSPGRAWGWMVVNYKHYRGMKREEDRREYHQHYWQKRKLNTETQQLNKNSTPSTESTESTETIDKRQEKVKTKRAKGALSPLPKDWFPSEGTVSRLSEQFRFSNGDAERYIEVFRDICASKGHEYKDFDAAFSNCVRQDWPKFRNGMDTMPKKPPILLNACSRTTTRAFHPETKLAGRR